MEKSIFSQGCSQRGHFKTVKIKNGKKIKIIKSLQKNKKFITKRGFKLYLCVILFAKRIFPFVASVLCYNENKYFEGFIEF